MKALHWLISQGFEVYFRSNYDIETDTTYHRVTAINRTNDAKFIVAPLSSGYGVAPKEEDFIECLEAIKKQIEEKQEGLND